MGTTAKHHFPYPEGSDPPAGHTQIKALADAVDAAVADFQLIDHGRPQMTFSNSATASVAVTFAKPFKSPPAVVASGENRYRNISVDNITVTGCTIIGQTDSADTKVSGTIDVQWIAIGDPA